MTLHFELWQLALFYMAMGIGLAEIGDNAAADGGLDQVDSPRKRSFMYLLLFLFWWLVIPLGGLLLGFDRWLNNDDDKKGNGPWD